MSLMLSEVIPPGGVVVLLTYFQLVPLRAASHPTLVTRSYAPPGIVTSSARTPAESWITTAVPLATGSSAGKKGCATISSPLNVSVSSPAGVSSFLTVRLDLETRPPTSQAVAHGGSTSGRGSSRISLGGLVGSSRHTKATVMTNGPTGGCTPSQRLTT